MVTIFKKIDSGDRFGTTETHSITTVDNYKEALERIKELTEKNKNPKVSFFTGNIYR